MKILALDDEQGALNLLVKTIKAVEPDSDINSFLYSDEALEFLRENEVDVVFSDIHIRDESGIDFAKEIQKIYPDINIIFTTGYSEHAMEALKLHSSGYIMKPVTKADVKEELAHLRNAVEVKGGQEKANSVAAPKITVKTFGNFDIFANDKAVTFRRAKSKELLAYLIDREGSTVTRKEAAAIIFEDKEYSRSVQAYLSQIIQNLRDNLEEYGIGDILIFEYNSFSVDTSKFTCDAYEYKKDKKSAKERFNGEYMMQYSWAEENLYSFFEED